MINVFFLLLFTCFNFGIFVLALKGFHLETLWQVILGIFSGKLSLFSLMHTLFENIIRAMKLLQQIMKRKRQRPIFWNQIKQI